MRKQKQTPLSVLLNKEMIPKNTFLTSYAVKFSDNTTHIFSRQICCSQLNWRDFRKPITEFIFSVKNRLSKHWYNHPRWNEFLYFMLNKSFISDVFLTKNVGNANKHGIKMNIEWSSNYILGGYFFLRCAWEFPWYLNSFFKMVDKGIDWNLALLQCQFTEFYKDKGVGKIYSSGHHPHDSLSKETALLLLTKKLEDSKKDSGIKSGRFARMEVNKTLSCGFSVLKSHSSFIFETLQQKNIGRDEWGLGLTGYDENDFINALKEFQKECLK